MKRSKNGLTLLIVLVVALLWTVCSTAIAAQCPSSEKVSEAFSKVFKREVNVIGIKESTIPGLCEVDMMVNNRKGILYIDADAKYFVAGQIIDIAEGKNLTQEAMQELNRLSSEEMKKLDSLTAFTLGSSGKLFYYVTDPQCPYCKKGEEIIKKLANEGKVTVKFLFYPLPMHEGAEQQCVSIICDNKGLEGLEKGYKSDNQCPEGVKKVQDTIAFLKAKGITGTPVYIFPDGSYHPGLMQEGMLLNKLGIEPEKPAAKEEMKSEQAGVGEAKKDEQPSADENKQAGQPSQEKQKQSDESNMQKKQ